MKKIALTLILLAIGLLTIASNSGIKKALKKTFKKGKVTAVEQYLSNWVEMDVILEEFTAYTRLESERIPKIFHNFFVKGSKVRITEENNKFLVNYKRKGTNDMGFIFKVVDGFIVHITVLGYQPKNTGPLKHPSTIKRIGEGCN